MLQNQTNILLLIILLASNVYNSYGDKNATVITAELGETYTGNVGGGRENIYFFNLTNQLSSLGTVRIQSCSIKATIETPMFFVVRKLDGVVSWSVPYTTGEHKYSHYTQTICRTITTSLDGVDNFYLDISTLHPTGFDYAIQAVAENDYALKLNTPLTITAVPAQLSFFTYTFQPDDESVLVKATSKNHICSVLVVQELKNCASITTKKFSGPHATMTTKAGIVVEKKSMSKIYILFMVKDSDVDCQQRKGTINPFTPHDLKEDKEQQPRLLNARENIRCSFGGIENRNKSVTITVSRLPRIEDYQKPVAIPLVAYGLFYLITIIVLGVQWCLSDTGGRSFYTYMFPKKVKKQMLAINNDGDGSFADDDNDATDGELNETDRLIAPNRQMHTQGSYSSIGPHGINNINANDDMSNPSTDRDYDFLDDISQDKDVYRLNLNLHVADTTKKSYKKLEKKFNIYYWNLMTVAVFYALPVVQLVLTYQRVTNQSGDQDICYYNFFCQRPYHILSAFNNVYSNVGYVMLGLLFIFFVMRRDRLSYQHHVKNPEIARKYGLPKHYGIFYAMGWSLVMEGIMSGCYHVCPNYSNFQFDTAFMYILGILCSLRLYQGRHHDVFINGHFAFAGFAVVIFTAVIGVIYRSKTFWLVFCFVHIPACLYLSLQVYYMGRAKTALQLAWHSRGFNMFSRFLFPVRFVLLLIFNIVNWSLSIYGATVIPKDFATYLLGIIICNGLLYVIFYGVMKLVNKEKVNALTVFFVVTSVVTWGVALKYFVAGLTDWQTSAAQSREGNRDCIIYNFYDSHDLWHFLSAIALFFSFMCVLTIDDDLDSKERDQIAVF